MQLISACCLLLDIEKEILRCHIKQGIRPSKRLSATEHKLPPNIATIPIDLLKLYALSIPLHQNLPHNTKNPVIRTHLLSVQILIQRPRWSICILTKGIDSENAILAFVVFRVLLVAPVSSEG